MFLFCFIVMKKVCFHFISGINRKEESDGRRSCQKPACNNYTETNDKGPKITHGLDLSFWGEEIIP